MKYFFKLAIAIIGLQFASSCAQLDILLKGKKEITPIDYLQNGSKINIKNFLNGDLEGFAIIQNADGKIESSFTVKSNGKWEENRGTVQYNYTFNGGKKDSRTWLITANENGDFGAIGHDFVETGQGSQVGNTARVNYSLMTNYKDVKQKIEYEDKFYLVDDNSAIIISTMSQGRQNLGKAIISLRKK